MLNIGKVKKDGFPSFISQLFELQVFRRGLRLRPSVPRREHRMLALHLRHDASDGGTVGSALHERLVREAQTLRGLLECPSDVRLPAAAERDAFFEHGSEELVVSSKLGERISFAPSGTSASALLRASSAASAL